MRQTTLLLGILCSTSTLACKPAVNSASKDLASARGSGGQPLRCGTILPSVENAAIKSLSAMVKYNKNGGQNAMARTVSQGTVTMLENMMRHPSKPIHPIAFYAAVKDFETAASLEWASKSGGNVRYFTTGNCTSGQCFGLYQVDVKLESAWKGGSFCQSDGLNLWSTTTGGPDFCAAQFWWTVAEGGRKCESLSGSSANPCTDSNYTWTLNEVRRGRAAYVQAIQDGWNSNAWAEMYQNYEKCYTDKKPLLKAIAEFRVAVGLAPLVSDSGTTNDGSVTINFPKPAKDTTTALVPQRSETGELKDSALFWSPEFFKSDNESTNNSAEPSPTE